MAANKFATMLNKNTNKITLVLVYAILEWVLILLLLLNSIFSYLIIKFADYFGLKRPCLLCSRLDHLFEPKNLQSSSYRSLVCEAHAFEISQLGYCLNHKKLAESRAMCGDCLSNSKGTESGSGKVAFFPWMKQLGVAQVSEERNGELCFKCSCCGATLEEEEKKLFFEDDHLANDSFWEGFGDTQEGNLAIDCGVGDKVDKEEDVHKIWPSFVSDHLGEDERVEENRGVDIRNRTEEAGEGKGPCFDSGSVEMAVGDCNGVVSCVGEENEAVEEGDLDVQVDNRAASWDAAMQVGEDRYCESQPQHLEFFIDQVDCHLIPIESVESGDAKEQQVFGGHERNEVEDFLLEFDKDVGTQYELVVEEEDDFEEEVPLLLHHEIEKQPRAAERSLVDNLGPDSDEVGIEQVASSQATQMETVDKDDAHASFVQEREDMEPVSSQASEELLVMLSEETEADVSIGTEIPEHEAVDDIEIQEVPSISNASYSPHDDPVVSDEAEEHPVEFRTVAIETSELVVNTHLPPISESNEIEEDAVPDTPTSLDSFHHIHRKLLMLERRESGTEESLDGSMISDIDTGDAALTVEKLKSALRAERKTLHALYSELEEERNASAVAANQTMAMINRLQEEKAAMQMEALQYQRMMDEQSEYDQEALQLLNELMMKREREKEELERELELYRKKVHDYEAREKMMMLQRRKKATASSGTPTVSCTNSEDSDGHSVDFSDERKEGDGVVDDRREGSNQNTPVDAVLYLEESLTNFEEERLSILEQLKTLEAKLFMLSDDDGERFEDIKSIEHLYEANGNGNGYHGEECDHNGVANGAPNGNYNEMNGKHHQERKSISAKAKRLLPLFDAIDLEAENEILNGHSEMEDGPADVVLSVEVPKPENKLDSDDKKLAIEEEVDHVYERLQALEADREFLKHCVSSMRKGDKGVELLQEILQHLRDLRSVELRSRSIEDGSPDPQ